jgi:hypothetical protein
MKTEYQKLQKTILEFSIENHCVINPDGWRVHLDGYLERGHCRCDKARLKCPCDEAPNELKEKGRCLCGLYWSSYETYWFARHFEDALTRVAVVTDAQPDASPGDHLPSKKEDDSKSPKLKKFEALLNFSKDYEESPPPSYDYIAEAVSLLTDKAGISLEDSRRVTIFKDNDGSICVDIVPPQRLSKPGKTIPSDDSGIPSSSPASAPPIIPSEDIEIRLLKELYKSPGNNNSSKLIRLAIDEFCQIITPDEKERRNDSGRLYWPSEFRSHLEELVRLGDIAEYGLISCYITDQGLARIGVTKPKPCG